MCSSHTNECTVRLDQLRRCFYYYLGIVEGRLGESSKGKWTDGRKRRLLSCSTHLSPRMAVSTYLRRKRSTWSAAGEEKGGWAPWAGLQPELCTLYRLYYCAPTDPEDSLLLVRWGCTRPFFETSSSLAKWRCNASLSLSLSLSLFPFFTYLATSYQRMLFLVVVCGRMCYIGSRTIDPIFNTCYVQRWKRLMLPFASTRLFSEDTRQLICVHSVDRRFV